MSSAAATQFPAAIDQFPETYADFQHLWLETVLLRKTGIMLFELKSVLCAHQFAGLLAQCRCNLASLIECVERLEKALAQ